MQPHQIRLGVLALAVAHGVVQSVFYINQNPYINTLYDRKIGIEPSRRDQSLKELSLIQRLFEGRPQSAIFCR